ncbi:uncharacterized protein [Diabrotica undecimpunctata]|uniref:uncharacterized protein n=1 Tax=Diabrotica undecimpunctata TaxID=50387 RepID=UPI003B64097E
MFTRPVKQSVAATIASFKISYILTQHKKPFEGGAAVKEAFIEATNLLFEDFKNKTDVMSAIKEVQLSHPTVTRHIEIMGKELESQVKSDNMKCMYSALQFDKSTDMTDTAQLCIFIRMVFSDTLA